MKSMRSEPPAIQLTLLLQAMDAQPPEPYPYVEKNEAWIDKMTD